MSFLNASFFKRVDEKSPCSFTSLFFRFLCKSDFQVCPFVRTSLSPFSMRKDLLPPYIGNTVYRQSNASGYNKEPTCMRFKYNRSLFLTDINSKIDVSDWQMPFFFFFQGATQGPRTIFFWASVMSYSTSKVSTHICLKAMEGAQCKRGYCKEMVKSSVYIPVPGTWS